MIQKFGWTVRTSVIKNTVMPALFVTIFFFILLVYGKSLLQLIREKQCFRSFLVREIAFFQKKLKYFLQERAKKRLISKNNIRLILEKRKVWGISIKIIFL
jgi:hypothetical protein